MHAPNPEILGELWRECVRASEIIHSGIYPWWRSSEKTITCYLFPPYSLNLLPSLSNLFCLPSDGLLPGFCLLGGPSQWRCLLRGFLILSPVSLLILNSMICVLELGPALPKSRSNQLRSGWEMYTLRACLAALKHSQCRGPSLDPSSGNQILRVCMLQPRSDILRTALRPDAAK